MACVLVERSFETPVELPQLHAQEVAVAWCLELHGVRFQSTFVSTDRRRMVCRYDAPDADAVRKTQDTGALPYERIWSAIQVPGFPDPAPADFETVVVERDWTQSPVTVDRVGDLMRAAADCMNRLRTTLAVSYVALDGRHQICVFRAPDAEAVRRANGESGIDMLRAWKASVHEAASPPER